MMRTVTLLCTILLSVSPAAAGYLQEAEGLGCPVEFGEHDAGFGEREPAPQPEYRQEPPRQQAATPGIYQVQGRITSTVGWRLDPVSKKKWQWHRGWDIAMPTGTPVRPSSPGVVSYSGWYKGYGYLVAVDHRNGYVTMYGHNSRNVASVGQSVDTGTVIAYSGSTGRSTGPHLHYEIRNWGRQ